MASQWGIRERLGRAARWAGRRHVTVLAILAMVAAPIPPHSAAAGVAASTAPPLAVLAASPSGPDDVGLSVPLDNTADDTPEDDSVHHDQSTPPILARAATLERECQDASATHSSTVRSAVDDAFLAGVYRCNPDGRGPPRRR